MITHTVTVKGTSPAEIAKRLPDAVEAGLHNVSLTALSLAEKRIQRIYSRRIPTIGEVAAHEAGASRRKARRFGHGGTPAWKRTGALRRSLNMRTWATMGGGRNAFISADRSGMYSGKRPRHGLGVGWMPKRPALGIVRRNPWWLETDEKLSPQVLNRFADGFKAVMK